MISYFTRIWCFSVLIVTINSYAVWQKDVEDSLNKNILGHCSWTFGEQNSEQYLTQTSKPDSFVVSVHVPSKEELKRHRSTPITLSKAYSTLGDRVREEGIEEWAREKGFMWQLPNDHPAQDRSFCLNITMKMAHGNIESLYEAYKTTYRGFYVLHHENAYIHATGAVGASCGYFQGVEGCETRWDHGEKWWKKCNKKLMTSGLPWSTLWIDEEDASPAQLEGIQACKVYGMTPKQYDEVFVIDALWDFNFHHFMVDSAARMVRHIDFLRAHPKIMIHIRAFDRLDITRNRTQLFKDVAGKMRNSIFDLLRIDLSRVIYGPVLAKKVYIPRALRCSYALSNPMEIRLLGRVMADSARKQLNQPRVSIKKLPKRNIVILQRYAMLQVWGWREWSNDTLAIVVQAFEKHFPDHNIVTMNSNTINTPEYCLACEILEFTKADILVGVHGAGLTNMMYMPMGSLVVELATNYNPAVMPVCGYYGSMAALCGHHHYLYAYNRKDDPPIDTESLAREVREYYSYLNNIIGF